MKSILLFIFSLASFWAVQAQDIHFTQFTLQGLQQSPALTGNFEGNFRFAALYRNQWATVAVPYNTLGFQFDGKVYETKKFTSFLASGLLLSGDQAGDAQLRTYQAQIPLSYTMYLALSKQTSLKIGSGLYAGLLHKSININNLQFDNQYNGDFFDPQIAIAENFGNLQMNRLDLGWGANIGINIKEKTSFGIALGMHHLVPIKESFIAGGEGIVLQRRYSLPAFASFSVHPKWDIRLDYLFQKQGVFHEHVYGAIASYYFKKSGAAVTALEWGSYYRHQDALAAIVRFRKNSWLASFSYDVNLSNARPATNTYGGTEIALVYILKKVKEPQIKNKRQCYVF